MIDPKKHLLGLNPYQLPEGSRKNKIRLDMNENLMHCSPKVLEVLTKLNPEDIASYPENGVLVKKLATQHRLAPGEVLVTNGGDDAIRCIMDTYIDSEESVVITTPSYSMFKIILQQRNAHIIEVLYTSDFSFPVSNFLSAIGRGVRMAIMVNPGNPTGTSIREEDLMRILIKAQGSEVIVVLDETYCHYAMKSYIELVAEFDNLIVMHTMSKAYGLTGLRVGYIASNRFNIEQLNKINLPFPVNALAIPAAQAALEDSAFIEMVIREVQKEKQFLYEELQKLDLAVKMTDINFLLIDFEENCNRVHTLLMERGILVKNMNAMPLMNGYLRISIGTRKEHILLLKALEEILPELKKTAISASRIQAITAEDDFKEL